MAMTASARRARLALTSLATALAVMLAAGATLALTNRYRTRVDLTAAGTQSLSPRTRAVLASLPGQVELLIVNAPDADRRARRALTDLLDALDRQTPNVSVTTLDPGSPDGSRRFDDLLRRLAEERRPLIEVHTTTLDEALRTIGSLADPLQALSEAIEEARASLAAEDRSRDALATAAGALRVRATELRAFVQAAEARRALPNAGLKLPATDDLREPARALLDRTAKDLQAISAVRLGQGAPAIAPLRDRALAAADALNRLGPLDLLSLVRAVESGPGVLLISDTALTAVAYDALVGAGGGEGEARFYAEQLLATALASLVTPPPTVVLVHAVTPRLLNERSNPESPEARAFFAGLLQRLANLGHAVVEWPVALQTIEPSLPETNPPRPTVYVIIPPAASAREASSAIPRLASVTKTLLDRGESALLTLEPSLFPRVGQPDPFADLLAPFSIRPDTGRPLVQRLSTPRGPLIWPEFRALAARDASHPIAISILGLSLSLPWPSPLRVEPPATPLLTIPESGDVWGESQWLTFRSVPREQRAVAPDPPTRDATMDNVDGPWNVAAASERIGPHGERQRLVAVASSAWFFDPVALEPDPNAPRPAPLNPGNSELFDASLRWLAGQDDLLAPGPVTLATPRIPPMTDGALTALRWGVTLAPPALVLLIGVVVRIIRR